VAAVNACVTASTEGASSGSQMSYQFCRACSAFGTPRGGRRTVPMRRPSPRARRTETDVRTAMMCEAHPMFTWAAAAGQPYLRAAATCRLDCTDKREASH
jgi:hypothetical protein